MCADIQSPVRSNNDSTTNFSPVAVRESPARKTPQRGNLTGNPRRIRDLAADLYNLIQKWNSCHISGVNILSKISQIKLKAIEGAPKNEMELYPKDLQNQCDRLEEIYKDMNNIVFSMKNCANQLKAVGVLEKYQNDPNTMESNIVSPPPVFLTWPAERFGEVSTEIVSHYLSEIEVKKMVLEGVCHCKSSETLMFHVAAWVHQPTILNENELNVLLEALLLETGHR